MKYTICILIFVLSILSCKAKSLQNEENTDKLKSWVTYRDTIPEKFIITFKYPRNLNLTDIIDNCRCVGERTKFYHKEGEASEKTNTNQWCICMYDKSEYNGAYLANSWKKLFKGRLTEHKDSVVINNMKALQVILKGPDKDEPFKHLIYLEKFSTLFEIINKDENTEKDFKTFINNIKIEETTKPSP
jgi:hypothetical protein